jgi:hypothetical protein
MLTDPTDPVELEAAITAVYRGPLEDFIGRRDALAKQLRAAQRRDDADTVKALRKPSRMAWALDQVVFEDPDAVEQLAGAITGAQIAHDRTGEARAAQEYVRTVVRVVAEAGARASIRGGHPIESSELVAAVRAVIGEADAFAALRVGRLVDVPEGGGLDLLAAMSGGASLPSAPSTGAISRRGKDQATAPAVGKGKEAAQPNKKGKDEAAAAPTRKGKDTAAAPPQDRPVASRAELNRAESTLAKARHHEQAALRVAQSVEARLEAAERQLQRVREQVETRRAELERAQEDASNAAAAVDEAVRALAALRGGE